MQKIRNLIRVDCITMNGGKNNLRILAVLLVLFCGGTGLFVSPLGGLYYPLIMGFFLVPLLFQNEIKYHSEKMHGLLPIARKDLVNARFLFTIGLYVTTCLGFYLLMLLSMKLKLYYLLGGEEFDVLKILVWQFDYQFTEFGLFNLLYFSVFSIGMKAVASGLRKYFKDHEHFNMTLSIGQVRKANKEKIVWALIILGCVVFWALLVSGMLPIGGIGWLVVQLVVQLAQAADGFLLGSVLVTMAVFSAIYKYVCTMIEYDAKEL